MPKRNKSPARTSVHPGWVSGAARFQHSLTVMRRQSPNCAVTAVRDAGERWNGTGGKARSAALSWRCTPTPRTRRSSPGSTAFAAPPPASRGARQGHSLARRRQGCSARRRKIYRGTERPVCRKISGRLSGRPRQPFSSHPGEGRDPFIRRSCV